MKELEGYIEHGIGENLKAGAEVTIALFTPIVERLKDPVRRRWYDATRGRRRLNKLKAKRW